MLHFRAPNLSGTSVQYSPFLDNRIALGTAANFGIVGNGRVFSLDIQNNGQITVQSSFETQDSVLGVAWSEAHENHLGVSCGDGSVQIFDTTQARHPLLILKEHAREASSISWSGLEKQQFCTSSWDGTIKVWSANGSPTSLVTLVHHPSPPAGVLPATKTNTDAIHEVKYSPHTPGVIGSAHADGQVVIWDIRSRSPTASFRGPAGSGECLTMDWNKYRPNTVASAGSDGVIRIWDVRNPRAMLVNELRGHELAVKSVKWSPHTAQNLLSVSYDMTAKVWVDNQGRVVPGTGARGLLKEFKQHTEFVTACDWSLWGQPGWVATTSFDSNLFLWRAL